jgi:hypothetical protein
VNPELVSQLRDIQGLDNIPWWPLASGWWLLAALVIALIVMLVSLIRNLLRFPAGSWRRHAWKQLRDLKQRSGRVPVQELASDLSELLRRIAIARLGREQAAGLSGERWLAWLQQHDPAGFEWTQRGKPLLTLPYAPEGRFEDARNQLLPLINATFAWVNRRERLEHV